MSYEAAIKKAWDGLAGLSDKGHFSVSLLNDKYEIDLKKRSSVSSAFKAPTKDFLTILLLHYLIGKLHDGYSPSGEWVSFKDLEGGEIYYPAFREAAIRPILKKYGGEPENILKVLGRLKGERTGEGDVAVEVIAFDDISVRIILWKGDEEFGPEATMLFDKNLAGIYSTEDIAVFARFVAHNL